MKKGINIFILAAIFILTLGGVAYFFISLDEAKENNQIDPYTKQSYGAGFDELTEDEIKITEFKTDKKNYGSYEEIKISIKILSKRSIGKAEVKITGIKPRQYAHISESKIVDLIKGENAVHFQAKTPYCTSGCGGVYPGPYDIYVDILVDGNLIESAATTINLVESKK